MAIELSIYATVYNNGYIINESINSLINALDQVGLSYEIIIIDNFSNDGTWEKIVSIAKGMDNIKLYRMRCSRGRGRNVALNLAQGRYALYVDLDCIFNKLFSDFIYEIHKILRDKEIWNNGYSLRDTCIRIGGWKDLNMCEDVELYCRAIKKGVHVYRVMIYGLYSNVRSNTPSQHGELRYSRGLLDRIMRTIRIRKDSIKGCRFNSAILAHLSKNLRTKIFNYIIASIWDIIVRDKFDLPKPYTNSIEYMYDNMHLVFPEDVGLPHENLLFIFNLASISWMGVRRKIIDILRKDEKIRIALLNNNIVVYRYEDILRKFLRDFARFREKIYYFRELRAGEIYGKI